MKVQKVYLLQQSQILGNPTQCLLRHSQTYKSVLREIFIIAYTYMHSYLMRVCELSTMNRSQVFFFHYGFLHTYVHVCERSTIIELIATHCTLRTNCEYMYMNNAQLEYIPKVIINIHCIHTRTCPHTEAVLIAKGIWIRQTLTEVHRASHWHWISSYIRLQFRYTKAGRLYTLQCTAQYTHNESTRSIRIHTCMYMYSNQL